MRIEFVFILTIASMFFSTIEIVTGKAKKLHVFLLVCMIFTASCLRDIDIVSDSFWYEDNYDMVTTGTGFLNYGLNIYGFEKGFMAWNWLIKSIGGSSRIFFGICTLVCLALVVYSSYVYRIRCGEEFQKRAFLMCTFTSLWLGYFGLMYGMVLLRSGLAGALGYCSVILWKSKKRSRAVLLCVLSILFHQSVIIFYGGVAFSLLLPIAEKGAHKVWLLLVFLLWVTRAGLFLLQLLQSLTMLIGRYVPNFWKYGYFYFETISTDGYLSKKMLMYFALAVLFVYVKPRENEGYNSILKIFMTGLTVSVLTNGIVLSYRISDMFLMFSVPLSYYLVTECHVFNKRDKSLVNAAIFILQFVTGLRIFGIAF